MKENKRVGRRKSRDETAVNHSKVLVEADQWLRTVQRIRGTGKVCKRGLYRFGTFEEADQWMETMILSSSRESRRWRTS